MINLTNNCTLLSLKKYCYSYTIKFFNSIPEAIRLSFLIVFKGSVKLNNFEKITILLLIWSNTLNSGNDISRSITFRVYLKIESQPRLRECGDRISYAFLFLNELQEIWPFDAIWTESYVRVKYMGLLGIKV